MLVSIREVWRQSRTAARARKAAVVILAIFFCATASAAAVAPVTEKFYGGDFTYVAGPGDVLEIKVWRHPDLSDKVTVRPDGNFSFPLAGEVRALDRTIPQVSDTIATALSVTLNEPVVTINVLAFQSQKIFVLGEVNRPGVYPFEGRVSIVGALSKAAGYKTDTAALDSVVVIRRQAPGKSGGQRYNIQNAIHKGEVAQDVYLQSGDIVFVPKTFIANVTTFISEFLTKTDPVLQYYLDIYNITNPGVLTR